MSLHAVESAIQGEGSPMTPGAVVNTYQELKSQLDMALYGEDYAKDIAIAAVASQNPAGFFGLAGGGKSTLTRSIAKAIGLDYYSDDVAFVPGQHDLTATRVVGGTLKRTKKAGSGEAVEEFEEVKGIFQPTTVLAHFEEITGTNPYALRASMSVFESKQLETNAGVTDIPNLLTALASGNPSRREDGTFLLPDPVASRIAMGAIMGIKPSTLEARIAHNRKVKETKQRGGEKNVQPVTNPEQLRAIGRYLAGVAVDSAAADKLDLITVGVADMLKEEFRVSETDNRISLQLDINARALAGLRNADYAVREEDIFDATRSVIAARMGTKPHKEEDLDRVEDLVKTITRL